MGVEYRIVNKTKKEVVSFFRIPASKARELTGNPIAAAITTWYFIENRNDVIRFCSDEEFYRISNDLSFSDFVDVTDKIIDDLIKNEILEDKGISILDEEEPELYYRNLVNIWMKN